jgi:hypothetical protein
MDVFTLEHLPEETEMETKMQYSLPGQDRDRDKNAIFSTWTGQR